MTIVQTNRSRGRRATSKEAEQHRLNQAQDLISAFEDIMGRPPCSIGELEEQLRERPEAFERVRAERGYRYGRR